MSSPLSLCVVGRANDVSRARNMMGGAGGPGGAGRGGPGGPGAAP